MADGEQEAFRVGDEVVVAAASDGRAFLDGRLTAIRGQHAIVRLNHTHAAHGLSGSWLLLKRSGERERWRDPVTLDEVRLFRHSPRLRNPWGNRHIATAATMRRRDVV